MCNNQLTVNIHHEYEIFLFIQDILQGISYITTNLAVAKPETEQAADAEDSAPNEKADLQMESMSMLDADGDGVLTPEELEEIDVDKDGSIDEQEFLRAVALKENQQVLVVISKGFTSYL